MVFRKTNQCLVMPVFIACIAGCTVAFPIENGTDSDTDTTALLGSDKNTADDFSKTELDSITESEENPPTDRELDTQTQDVIDTGTDTEIATTPEDSETESVIDTDQCPGDPSKDQPGICGCGVPDSDSDADGTADCEDECPSDPDKVLPGECGCNQEEGTCSVDPLGTYHRLPVENDWHIGDIERDGDNYRWLNAAGVSWILIPDLDNNRLFTQSDCPYYHAPSGDRFILIVDGNTVTGFDFQGELYSKQN